MRIILIGPPGSGKGTQAAVLKAKYQIAHISTGDILRENLRAGLALGVRAKQFMDAGALVPDDLIIGMMRERLSKDDAAAGFVLDGFPRTVAQAEALDDLMQNMSIVLDAVILLEISDDTVVERLSGRRVCSSCGAIYHTKDNPTASEGICDVCKGSVIQRDDDKEDVIRKRLSVYHNETAPLVDYYEKSGAFRRIDTNGPLESFKSHLESIGL